MLTPVMPAHAARSVAIAASILLVALCVVGCTGGAGDSARAQLPDASPSCDGPSTATSEVRLEPVVDRASPQLPVTLTDASGQSVTIEDASRILALDTYGTLAATVHALGLGDRLVGRDVSTGLAELADLPVVTHNGHELNAEAILELDPTVVLTDDSIGPLEVQLQLQASGIPVVFLDGRRRADLIEPQIVAVADALGVPGEGERLAERVRADVAAARTQVDRWRSDAGDPALRMVFLYLRGNAGVYYWFGEGSGADDLIDALGGVDVAGASGLTGHRPVNAEGLVRAEPDLYLMMTDGLDSVGGVDGLLEVPGVADTPAGIGGCVVDMADSQILSFGPQYPSTLRALGAAVYGAHDVAPGAR
jgi:iron complex transport system substrate-binding protein